MKEKNYVFDKLELAILVLFFVILCVTSFVLGSRYGKKEALAQYGQEEVIETTNVKQEGLELQVSQSDERKLNDEIKMTLGQRLRKQDEFKKVENTPSVVEVENDILLKKNEETKKALSKLEAEVLKVSDSTQDKAQTEVESIETIADPEIEITKEVADKIVEDKIAGMGNESEVIAEKVKSRIDSEVAPVNKGYNLAGKDLIGKYTIQLGSYKTLREAQDFAATYSARNYRPIINEVELSGRGKWFRVSLGVFDSQVSASRYVKRESAIFNNKKFYVTIIE